MSRWNNSSSMRLLMLLAVLLPGVGCQQQMAEQPRFDAFEPCEFFDDGTTARHLPDGTVARGHLRSDRALYTGKIATPGPAIAATNASQDGLQPLLSNEASQFTGAVAEFPLSITRDVVQHGRNRYMIYCVVCHDALGTGHGKIVERGYTRPPSFHIARLREVPPGYVFRVISQGYGSMPSYATQIEPRDRWAIVAYIRALQLSQHFPEAELTDQIRAQLPQASISEGGG